MKIQLKRSNVIDNGAAKEPTASQMEYGELAVNYSEADPAIFIKDSTDNIIRIAGAGANGDTELPESGGDPHQPGTTDDRYVELTGDNMTGNLTLGTDKITLNATDGSIAAAGDVTSDGYLRTTSFVNCDAYTPNRIFLGADLNNKQWGYYSTKADGTLAAGIGLDGTATFAENVKVGGTLPDAPNISLNADGTASFEKTVTITDAGAFISNRPNADDEDCFRGVGANKITTAIKSSGSLLLGPNIGSNDVKITLDGSDGSATFDGDVTIGEGANTSSTGVELRASGLVKASRPSATDAVWVGYQDTGGTGNQTSEIFADGSASFAGTINVGGLDLSDTNASGIEARPKGEFMVQRPDTEGPGAIFDGRLGSTQTVNIRANGSATFAGTVTENATRSGSVEILLEADDDTKYTSTTDSEGNTTLVYNGAVLDVKDRLSKADAALQTLKTAAAAASDFAALKAAIATALADI